ncbi:Gnat family acetyltransferase (fragment) [Legionella micdadei]|uniref:Acetyltransferase (GNAT) domain-containing protein n=2 Tax=Legionella micdadei TaxID=451 RepID=A0A098GHN8_LEGMI
MQRKLSEIKMNSDVIDFHIVENNFFSLVSVNQMDYDHLVAFTTGVQASGLNPAIVKHIDDRFFQSLNACQVYYEKNHVPWALVFPDYLLNETIERDVQLLGFSNTGTGVAMVAVFDSIQFPSQSLSLQCKLMDDDLHTWSIPLIYGFESTPEVTSVYTHRHQLASENAGLIYHFSGYFENTVVCSLTLSLCGNCARIDDVATMPAFQKQGFGSALIYEALKCAKELSISRCFLEASNNGLGLYKRIGFKALFTNHYYEKIPT